MAEAHSTSAVGVGRTRSGLALAVCGLVVAVAAESAVLIGGTRLVGLTGLILVVLASAAWAFVSFDERFERLPRLVVSAIVVAFAVALIVPPRGSHDLWSYVMYGRTISVHHLSPYLHPPSDFQHDALFPQVVGGWTHTKSVYGPLFTGMSAVLTRLAGDSVLEARLAFQGLATLGIVATLVLIWRTTGSVRSVAFVGLHPVVVTAIVNGGHNDSLVGLAILAGALLASRRRWGTSGFVLGLGILVKASAGLGLLGVALWTFRRDRRGAARLVMTAGITVGAAYVPAGIAAVRGAAHAGSNGYTRASPWDPISTLLHLGTRGPLAIVLLLAIAVAYRWRTADSPGTSALATTATYLIAGIYVLPWYPAWALPSAALERRSRLSVLVAVQAAFLVAVYELERTAHPTLRGAWAGIRIAVVQLDAWLAVAAFVVLFVGMRVRHSAGTRSVSPGARSSEETNPDPEHRTTEPAELLLPAHSTVVGETPE